VEIEKIMTLLEIVLDKQDPAVGEFLSKLKTIFSGTLVSI
jgi:hypothetical protein